MNSKAGVSKRISGVVVSMGLAATLVAGCAGGGFTTREKGAGIGRLAARQPEASSVLQSDIPAPVLPSAVL